VWIPFVDVDRDLFTMDIIPGSHKGGLYPYTRRDHIFEVDPGHYNPDGFVPMETARGDVVFMSSFSVHRSSTQGDDRLRVSTSMRYENASERYFIERSYPFAHKRSVIADLITPDFPSREQVRNIFEESRTPAALHAETAP
jgi:ectoine hydroxylase-related dioxygenase (phytanoyl-CoA dioxygenase family)